MKESFERETAAMEEYLLSLEGESGQAIPRRAIKAINRAEYTISVPGKPPFIIAIKSTPKGCEYKVDLKPCTDIFEAQIKIRVLILGSAPGTIRMERDKPEEIMSQLIQRIQADILDMEMEAQDSTRSFKVDFTNIPALKGVEAVNVELSTKGDKLQIRCNDASTKKFAGNFISTYKRSDSIPTESMAERVLDAAAMLATVKDPATGRKEVERYVRLIEKEGEIPVKARESIEEVFAREEAGVKETSEKKEAPVELTAELVEQVL